MNRLDQVVLFVLAQAAVVWPGAGAKGETVYVDEQVSATVFCVLLLAPIVVQGEDSQGTAAKATTAPPIPDDVTKKSAQDQANLQHEIQVAAEQTNRLPPGIHNQVEVTSNKALLC